MLIATSAHRHDRARIAADQCVLQGRPPPSVTLGIVDQIARIPHWAGYLPGVQLGIVILSVLVLLLDAMLPWVVGASLAFGFPLIFGAALAAGVWVSRRRGGTRPDGTEYVIATFGNVVMGLGLGLSVVLLVFVATFPSF
jgi:hypothetical protein